MCLKYCSCVVVNDCLLTDVAIAVSPPLWGSVCLGGGAGLWGLHVGIPGELSGIQGQHVRCPAQKNCPGNVNFHVI